ncbi:DUF805 domain-containing protein [Butyrivibrio sp. AE2032]|uniref:DUF805 domain-containing protein n=1 Tax=Butyrivibrio sp. AE2032 TaxID=1458463 RepID=UPI000556E4FA|nr:DUF805 domain-containing protein [Butyrivibrio sp. AE2032]
MSFIDAIKSVFLNFKNFSGRARRKEYWYYTIFSLAVFLLCDHFLGSAMLVIIVSLILGVPAISLNVRRLHDVGKPGTFYFFVLIPIVGVWIVTIWLLKDSQVGDNMYGPNPKGIGNVSSTDMNSFV